VAPEHITPPPDTVKTEGVDDTPKVADAEQPDGNVYTIIDVPELTLVTKPVEEPMVAMAGLLLVHTPPATASLIVVVEPLQTPNSPVSGAILLIVRPIEVVQPVGAVYTMLGLPAATPVTVPEEEPTVALVMSLLAHVPPLVRSLSVDVAPAHNVVVPVIDDGVPLTVKGSVVEQPEGNV